MDERNLEEKIDAGFAGVNARIETLDKSVNARIDTLDGGFVGLRTDLGDLEAHLFEVRDALFADNGKTREFVRIQFESLRTDLKERITKLETR